MLGISISLATKDNGILKRSSDSKTKSEKSSVEEEVHLMMADYMAQRVDEDTTLEEYLNGQKEKGKLNEVKNNGDKTITIKIKGYEVTLNESDLKIKDIRQFGKSGVVPVFDIIITKINGSSLTGNEIKKALTVKISNLEEFGSNYTIEVKDNDENLIEKLADVVTNDGQASYKIVKPGKYKVIVTGVKDGIENQVSKITDEIELAEEVPEFSRANGVIDIVWLNLDNTVSTKPISPRNYLSGMKAVRYNGSSWVETSNDADWYDYKAHVGSETSNWANAVAGNTEAYFVWIPRYAYKITYFNSAANANAYRENSSSTTGIIGYSTSEGLIDMTTGTPRLVSESEPINITGRVKTSGYEDYIPHPAFEFNGSEPGIWFGKFECVAGSNSNTFAIKPGSSCIERNFYDILNKISNIRYQYSLSNDADSHLVKNIEWGAAVYLTESKYGINGGNVSKNSQKVTGGGNYVSNVAQSTTGNVTGIYDMSGGYYEFVATSSISNDTDFSDPKYYDIYNNYEESKGMKGDAIFETSTFKSNSISLWHGVNGSFNNFVSYKELIRGGMFEWNSSGGIYAFGCTSRGGKSTTWQYVSSRAVLVP